MSAPDGSSAIAGAVLHADLLPCPAVAGKPSLVHSYCGSSKFEASLSQPVTVLTQGYLPLGSERNACTFEVDTLRINTLMQWLIRVSLLVYW